MKATTFVTDIAVLSERVHLLESRNWTNPCDTVLCRKSLSFISRNTMPIQCYFSDLQPGGDCRCFVCQTRCWIQQYKMSQPFRPHVNLFFFGLEWRLSRELMALDIMTSFHYHSIFILWIFSQLTTKLWIAMEIYMPCVKRFWSEWISASKCGVFLKL